MKPITLTSAQLDHALGVSTMANDKTHEGWKNYETWCVNLWITNDEGSNNDVERLSSRVARNADDVDAAYYELADDIKQFVEENMLPENGVSGLAADLLGAAMSEVDWQEIAESFLSEHKADIDARSAEVG